MKLELALRRKWGRSTEKCVARLRQKDKEKEMDVDVRPFVDKAAQRVSVYHVLVSVHFMVAS